MPRNGSDVYSKPSGTTAITGQTISSTSYNLLNDDIVTDLNTPRPVAAGGTGSTTAADARAALSAQEQNDTLQSLADTDLAGQAGQLTVINDAESGIGLATPVVLPDYAGEAGNILAVKPAEDGVEYIAPEFPGNQVLLDTFDITGETQWESPTLTTDYIGYRIKVVNAEIASAGTVALLGFSTNDGTSYDTNNFSTTTYIDTGSGGPGNITTGQLWSGESLSAEDFNLDVEIMRPDEAAFTTGRFDCWSSTASGHEVQKGHFTHRVASSINKIQLSDLAVATRGTLYLFGIKA